MKQTIHVLLFTLFLSIGSMATAGDEPFAPYQSEKGFTSLFNGKNLDGWMYDENTWSVQDGKIVGGGTKHTFCIYEKPYDDFVLKVKFKLHSGNSGIQYRSERFNQYEMKGYQAEVSGSRGDAGEMFGEETRGHTVPTCGEYVVIGKNDKRTKTRTPFDVDWSEFDYYDPDGWNEYTIVADGNHIKQYINGYLTAELIDHGKGKRMKGLIGLQHHGSSKPEKVAFKDIRIKELE